MKYRGNLCITLLMGTILYGQNISSIGWNPIKWYTQWYEQKKKRDHELAERQRKVQEEFDDAVKSGWRQDTIDTVKDLLERKKVIINPPKRTLRHILHNLFASNKYEFISKYTKESIIFDALPYPDILHLLIEHGADVHVTLKDGNTPLHEACKKRNVEALKILVKQKARMNVRNKQGDTPLHLFLRRTGWPEDRYAIPFEHYIDGLRFLLEHGASVHAKNNLGDTPLRVAIANERWIEVIQLLLHAGADVNAKNNSGRTVFIATFSPWRDKDNLEIIKQLIDFGAIVQTRDRQQMTPLHIAVEDGYPIDIIKLLLDKGAVIDAQDKEGKTPLWYAILKGNRDISDFLLAQGADISIKDNKGNTVLHTIASYPHYETRPLFFLIEYGIKHGIDINAKNKNGNTALLIAVRKSRSSKEFIQVLLQAGADITILNNIGQSPWSFRAHKGSDIQNEFEEAFKKLSPEQQKRLLLQESLYRKSIAGQMQ